MSKFNGFLDSVASGILGPKGNLADWQHASRLFVNDSHKHSPKHKFLYHVTFYLTSEAKSVIPEVDNYKLEIGMLVNRADLPSYTAKVETKNKYNRKKNVQTGIEYQPVNIEFHDDNFGATTALLEAYYKYYFADGLHTLNDGSYGNRLSGDTAYDGPGTNSYKFGMDNNIPAVPFFDRIEIAQLARRSYTKYTLVNPILTQWQHDQVDNAAGGETMKNAITVAYDTVFYERGAVEAGANGEPAGFGSQDHYDVTPSPISLLGGGQLGIAGIFGAGIDLYEYITKGANFKNPLSAGIALANLIRNVRDLDAESLRAGGMKFLTEAIGNAAGIDVSGVAQTFFPKNAGRGGTSDIVTAGIIAVGANAIVNSRNTNNLTPQQIDDARFSSFKKDYQNNGGTGGVNGARQAYDSLTDAQKEAIGV